MAKQRASKRASPPALSTAAAAAITRPSNHTPPNQASASFGYGALVLLNWIVFAQVRHFEFVNYDDPEYVSSNPVVAGGLSGAGIVWAFTTGQLANWHPVAWLSHMLDVQLWGMNAGSHHLTSLVIHMANSLLVFHVLRRMTAQVGRSLVVAGLFAVHPLHVEAVAWISERKELLSTFFGLLAVLCYLGYVRRPRVMLYLAVALFFALSLMSKPMLVTLPFVLLILDFWPLKRVHLGQQAGGEQSAPPNGAGRFSSLIWEKLPLLALSALSSVVTLIVQEQGGAVSSVEKVSWGLRLANAAVSYVIYLGDVVWPSHLAAFYPMPASIPAWQALGSALLLAAVTLTVLRRAARAKFLFAGWFWFLGTLIPVIGIVHVGDQARADRYTYFPLIGIFIILSWGGAALIERMSLPKQVEWVIAAGIILSFGAVASMQARTWRNGEQLWTHALATTENNYIAHNNLGYLRWSQGRIEDAIVHYEQAILANPRYPTAYNNLATALAQSGKLEAAIEQVEMAIRLKPAFAEAHSNLGGLLTMLGRLDEAEGHYQEALRLQPKLADAHSNLGLLRTRQGDWEAAIVHYEEALRWNPNLSQTRNNLGLALEKQGKFAEAIVQYTKVLASSPTNAVARKRLDDLTANGANLR